MSRTARRTSRTSRTLLLVTATATAATLCGTAPAQSAGRDMARQTLPAGDGWASEGAGTTGGSQAAPEHVYTVDTWEEFRTALAHEGTAPRIIKVRGTLNATANGCEAFEAEGYDFDQYLADYDPAVWGLDTPVSGPQEDLRAASAVAQDQAIKAFVPSNTTIIGVGRNAGITGGSLQIKDADNVIVRNLTIESPLDCFPQWDPTDGATGAWNSEYDAVVVYNSTHVWVDHNTLTDGRYPDSSLPSYFGETYQQHDGLLDIVRGSNYVTASWNRLQDHDKTLMIGNSDSAAATDAGKLKVTLHHNRFSGTVERAPRVRFGQVDVYNNHFEVKPGQKYGYTFGIGIESRLYAEKNSFSLPAEVTAGRILKKWKEAPLTAEGNYVNGQPTDLIAVHNTEIPAEHLQSGAGWTPTLRTKVDDPLSLAGKLSARAGAGKIC
ncbi:pectate lyase [Streptomyces sp. TRM66268-LWL]|uniref:Pectate lyase n=1 Tax=Streptomyces polyasparticus TaxID=2767826 RepID=A0ABR7SQX1_9ACTN|nr:pectate lyase [Streptomyces polyasparticus]MBC9716906.1 pectate lyase [Streptomyces polyasparticus]